MGPRKYTKLSDEYPFEYDLPENPGEEVSMEPEDLDHDR